MNEITTIDKQNLQDKIYTIRGLQVMLDRDLADLYNVETKNLRFQFGTLENGRGKHRKYLPYVFTEQGVYRCFQLFYERFERIEQRLTLHDKNFDKLFEALENKTKKSSEGIFFDGQIYDVYVFINDLLKSAKI